MSGPTGAQAADGVKHGDSSDPDNAWVTAVVRYQP